MKVLLDWAAKKPVSIEASFLLIAFDIPMLMHYVFRFWNWNSAYEMNVACAVDSLISINCQISTDTTQFCADQGESKPSLSAKKKRNERKKIQNGYTDKSERLSSSLCVWQNEFDSIASVIDQKGKYFSKLL